MTGRFVAGVALAITLAGGPAGAQGVRIETERPPQREPQGPVVAPPLHYEVTRPPDADVYPRGTRVEHDPAFIEPFAASYRTPQGSGRYGISGWTSPNPPVGATATNWREVTGYLAIGFSVTWDGPAEPSPRPAR